ncbi:calcium ion transporter [Grosmannia clavigera kw1407]|uniref:Calcium ion transporter n=1 Tax=Grosmannia clavigera (strain kw1407 / UAMH 11150) TaxID=655863 RepID=F0XUN7_GROCL|nr:calcium ion transporter [Grosmannia clavigera kw1407]EFW98911.1 calcium ion transporter [Grosmannia clavigera kw1407]
MHCKDSLSSGSSLSETTTSDSRIDSKTPAVSTTVLLSQTVTAVAASGPSPIARADPIAVSHSSAAARGWSWFRTELFCGLAVLAPVAIVVGALHWPSRVVFALSALGLAGLEVLVSTALERMCLAHADRNLLAAACLEILPSIFPTMIGIVSLVSDEINVAKSFVIGNVLNNILLGTGLSLFLGGFKPDNEGYAQHVSKTAFELVKLTLISTSPVIMAWAMIYVMTSQTELAVLNSDGVVVSIDAVQADINTEVSPATAAAIRGISHGTAVILLVVYVVWVLFRRVTHRDYFADDDRSRQAAATIVQQQRGVWPLLRKEAEGNTQTTTDGEQSRKSRLSAANITQTVAFAAAFAMAVFCSHYLVTSIDPLVEESGRTGSAAASSVRRHFVASILLPLIVNLYSDVRAAELASCGGRDISLAVHLTYGAGASSILLTLPVLVVIGWTAGHTLLLDFSAFDVSILAGGVWATSILTTNQVDYFRGFVFLCLYGILALAVFLFKE